MALRVLFLSFINLQRRAGARRRQSCYYLFCVPLGCVPQPQPPNHPPSTSLSSSQLPPRALITPPCRYFSLLHPHRHSFHVSGWIHLHTNLLTVSDSTSISFWQYPHSHSFHLPFWIHLQTNKLLTNSQSHGLHLINFNPLPHQYSPPTPLVWVLHNARKTTHHHSLPLLPCLPPTALITPPPVHFPPHAESSTNTTCCLLHRKLNPTRGLS